MFCLHGQGLKENQTSRRLTSSSLLTVKKSGGTPFTQHSDTPYAATRLTLHPGENKLQIKKQTLVQELDHQEKFRLYL